MNTPDHGFLYPAFIDSHLHFLGLGQAAFTLDLKAVSSIEELSGLLNQHKTDDFIIGRGWNQENFKAGVTLSKTDLNRITTQIPIILYRVCGHVAVVNDKVLAMIKSAEPIPGGTIDFETGILTENALERLQEIKPVPSREEIKKYLLKANEILLSQGITKVLSDDFIVFPVAYETIIEIINELYAADLLQVKIIEQVHLKKIEMLRDFIAKGYVNRDFGKWRLGPLKLLADGSLGARTAALRSPYHDDPGNHGIKTFSDSEMLELFNLANTSNMDCHIHAIGDGAIDQVLDLMERSLQQTQRSGHRHAIIHAQVADRRQIERMAKLQISAIVQPIFLESDIAMVDSRLGDRRNEAYLFRTMMQKRVNVGFSTDCPVESSSPFSNIHAAMTKTSVQHSGAGVYLPKEAFTLEECLRCYHENNKFLIYEEGKVDTDHIVLDRSIRHSSPAEILKARVLNTIIDGQVVFDATRS